MTRPSALRTRPNRCYRVLRQTKNAQRQRAWRQARRAAGLCTRCRDGVAVPGRSCCQGCLDAIRVRSQRQAQERSMAAQEPERRRA